MTQKHALLTATHRPYADVYADAADRLAATGFVRELGGGIVAFTAEDLYKKVLQLDDASEWILTAITPTWVQTSGAGSLANGSVANALLANMAQATIKGRASGAGTGPPVDLTATQATAILNAVVGDSGSGGTKGLVPAPAAGDAAAGRFLKADGTFAVPAGTGAETGANSDITSMDGLTGALQAPTQINDANGNEVVKFGSTASAVNEVKITNKATGTGPTIEATGGDTNINLNLVSKGTGVVQANGNELAIKNAEINAQTGTTYTLVAADNGKVVTCSNAGAITVTVPSGLGAGFNCLVVQLGAGQVTFSPSSTTVNNRQSHTKIAGQYGVASLVAYSANTFALGGDTAA